MRISLACLLIGYLLSQFYRAFLAVLAPTLTAELGVTAEVLARASGLWFLAFALTQLPLGWALDSLGPRRSAAWLTAVGALGAALFAAAQSGAAIAAAMVLLGIGAAPVLMAAYYIFGRMWPPAMFGTLAGIMLGIGSLGNIAAAWPLAWAVDSFGWRAVMLAIAVVTAAVALAIGRFVQDPPPTEPAPGGETGLWGGLLAVLRIPALWLIFPLLAVGYAPAAGLRGLWVGPYLEEVFGASTTLIGQATLVMALAMVAGSVGYGPLDRLFGTRKRVALAGNLAMAGALALLWAMPAQGLWTSVLLLSAVGMLGASFPLLMAHGRSFLPPHLLGRGVTMMNLFAIGGVGVLQTFSARVHTAAGPDPVAAHAAVFGFFGLCVLLGLALYAFSRDRTD